MAESINVNSDNLDQMIPQVHFKVLAAKNCNKPQIWISRTQLLIVIELHYLPQNICFGVWNLD